MAQVTENGMLVCEWFALCSNETLKALDHPVLGPTPCCERCAAKVGATDRLLDCEVTFE